jgi:hypothetical protein
VFQSSTYAEGGAQAFSGGVVALSSNRLGSGHECPCGAEVSLATEPAQGWSGTITAPIAFTTTTDTGLLAVALEGPLLFTSGGSTIGIYDITGRAGSNVGPPTVSLASASGLASGHPTLGFTVTTGGDDPRLASFTLRLPRGLSFTKNHARLAKAVSIAGAHDYTLSLEHGGLQVRMPVQAEMLQVQVGPRALAETKAMAHQASKLRKPTANHPVVALRASLHATDTTGDATNSILRFFIT